MGFAKRQRRRVANGGQLIKQLASRFGPPRHHLRVFSGSTLPIHAQIELFARADLVVAASAEGGGEGGRDGTQTPSSSMTFACHSFVLQNIELPGQTLHPI